MTVNGAGARSKGHTAERQLAAWLREHGYPDAETTRGKAGRDGWDQHTAGDIAGIAGLHCEVKNRARLAIGEWLSELDPPAGRRLITVNGNDAWAQSPTPLLVVKPRGIVNPGDWWAVQTLADWMNVWEDR